MLAARVVCAHVLLLLLLIVYTKGRKGIGSGEQDWGFITVRPNAHMFWWLYYTTHSANYTERPLIIWLQGGPGMASSGYGNFIEIGPLNASFHKRDGSFVENFNVLFVDNPVGVGYSYISDENTTLVTNGGEIGEDLYNFFKIFISTHHGEFKDVPVYVFGESYGGKMATELVYKIKQKEQVEGIKICNLRGLALGDAYISPRDYLEHYAPIALNLGLVDKRGFTRIDELAKQIQVLINEKEFKKAADTENSVIDLLFHETSGTDMNNFLEKTNSSKLPKVWDHMYILEDLMNGHVQDQLNITKNITWKFFGDDLYQSLKADLLQSVTNKIEWFLNTTDVKIIVYNGILDLLVNTAGTISWLDSLNWDGRESWFEKNQTPLIISEVSEGYFKRVDNLVFYAILRAGHSVPLDNLPVLNKILEVELLGGQIEGEDMD